ncbi:hypothetical protein ABZ471_48545, partial [Streptomyces sp. NPDC005728]|uniref:hypothetical protein n=1 Tax=Streptomyces sp. NPDC005728 TaxID=3157054 RepID=UPI0033D51CD6
MTSTPTGAGHNNYTSQHAHDRSQSTEPGGPSHRTGTTGAFRRIKKSLPRYDYEHYSRLAGPLT